MQRTVKKASIYKPCPACSTTRFSSRLWLSLLTLVFGDAKIAPLLPPGVVSIPHLEGRIFLLDVMQLTKNSPGTWGGAGTAVPQGTRQGWGTKVWEMRREPLRITFHRHADTPGTKSEDFCEPHPRVRQVLQRPVPFSWRDPGRGPPCTGTCCRRPMVSR